jgi:hypothetical protein
LIELALKLRLMALLGVGGGVGALAAALLRLQMHVFGRQALAAVPLPETQPAEKAGADGPGNPGVVHPRRARDALRYVLRFTPLVTASD